MLFHHRRTSSMETAWLHAGRVMFLQKLGSTAAAAKALRWTSLRQGVWSGATATHHWRSKGKMLLESREGDVPAVQQQPKSYDESMGCGQGLWWGATATHRWTLQEQGVFSRIRDSQKCKNAMESMGFNRRSNSGRSPGVGIQLWASSPCEKNGVDQVARTLLYESSFLWYLNVVLDFAMDFVTSSSLV